MKLGPAIERLQRAQVDLADDLASTAERHAAEADLYQLGHELARRARDLATTLEPSVVAYGEQPATSEDDDGGNGFRERLRRFAGDVVGRSERVGVLLLSDLRDLYLQAQDVEIEWTIVHQGAMAARDQRLVDACAQGLSETERTTRWLKARIKDSAPQVLMS
jgi:hypothetical protein